MSLSAKKAWLIVMWIVMLIQGILCCCMIFGLPFGIPAIIGATRFKNMKNLPSEQLQEEITQKVNFGWSIYAIIMCGVVGVLGMIFVYCVETEVQPQVVTNNKDTQQPQTDNQDEIIVK